MSKIFKQAYKDIMMPMPSLPLYGLGELIVYDGLRWEVTGFEPNEKEGCWVYDLCAVDGSEKKKMGVHELGLMKSYKKSLVEKPGASSIHTPKWDRCVKEVEANGSGNAYAICTSMMGESSFKSMNEDDFAEKVRTYLHKLGIADAGPVPNSLLSRQDLEPETRKGMVAYMRKSVEKSVPDTYAVWYYDREGAQKCATYNNLQEAEAFARVIEDIGFKNIKILTKGQVETTGKQLERAAAKAEDAETDEKKSIVENIKAIQIRRQKATIEARKSHPPFSSFWRANGKK